MFTFCKARWARRENHATEVTKIPKTKRWKYGMNETMVSRISNCQFIISSDTKTPALQNGLWRKTEKHCWQIPKRWASKNFEEIPSIPTLTTNYILFNNSLSNKLEFWHWIWCLKNCEQNVLVSFIKYSFSLQMNPGKKSHSKFCFDSKN